VSDLIHRAQRAAALFGDPSLPNWQRVLRALEACADLELSRLQINVREPFEADLVEVNQVLQRYPLETDEDYQQISEADIGRLQEIIGSLSARAIDAELDRIVAELDAGKRRLPVEAIQEAREHRELMIPRLIEVLKSATAAARAGNVPKGNSHFFAIFLLSEFRAEEAFPVMLEAFTLPGELPFELFGDAVHNLSRILAQFAGERLELIDTLVGDAALNEYVRWQAAETYVLLVRDGRLERGEAVERLRRLLRQTIDEEAEIVVSGIISVMVSFSPIEALSEIREAYDRGVADPLIVNLKNVEQSIAEGEAWIRKELARCRPTGIQDTIEFLSGWYAFGEEPVVQAPPPPVSPPRPHLPDFRPTPEREPVAALSRVRTVGRNDPCPCGSGKKYKKCCSSHK